VRITRANGAKVEQMKLLFVSPTLPETISSIVTSGDWTLVAVGDKIIKHKRAKPVDEMHCRHKVVSLSLLGDFLLALCVDNTIRIWKWMDGELETVLEFPDFHVSHVLHPSTYLNKILVASTQGGLQLWNIRRRALVHTFEKLPSGISCLTQSPVVDVVAIGCIDGTIKLHNVRFDETIMTLKQDGKVTDVSFRTDQESMMASSNMYGDVCLWDLEKRVLFHVIKGAHIGPIATCKFFNGQPLMITSGADNSVKQWLFDTLDGVPRILKSRAGHSASPTSIHYYDAGHEILSAARDKSLRLFSIIKDTRNVELSQGASQKKAKKLGQKVNELKLPPITCMASSETRQRDWDNIITGHANDAVARTWEMKRKALGNHSLVTADKTPVKAVNISHCGNFGMIGSAGGLIDMYNMQSGLHKRTFGHRDARHSKAVTGIVSDNTNRYVISISLDQTLRFWDFQTGRLIYTMSFSSPITLVSIHKPSELLAIACDDLSIKVVDMDTRKVVREFVGHTNRITDFCFSLDARWIVSASLDSSIRVWDLPTGFCIDAFLVDSIVTSLSFSPNGDFLATAHVDNVGIFLWTNKMQFGSVDLKRVEGDLEELALPSAAHDEETIEEELVQDLMHMDVSPQLDLDDELISLSNLPRSRWQTLLNLETVRKRNKPKEAPKAPEKAPFFLPTLAGPQPKIIAPSMDGEESKVLHMKHATGQTEYLVKLLACHETGDYSNVFEHVKTLSPAAMDFELQNLTNHNSCRDLVAFVESIVWCLESRRNFEMAEALLSAFLKVCSALKG
jgi:U3 small nucleolar RNA-associated protein 21